MKKFIVDIYGADRGPEPIIQGSFNYLASHEDVKLIFIGDSALVEAVAEKMNIPPESYDTVHTCDFITNNDPPTCVFRGSENTSMVMALDMLKNDPSCLGMISPGNTGALLVGSICRVGLVGKLKAPALATAIPCKKDGFVCLVDCGANTECTADDLKRYALMGNAFMQCYTQNPSPKVALMSVGKEKGKGNTLTRAAFEKLEALPINFVGNIEGNDLVSDDVDVIVTDGFTGNVLLKTTEAVGLTALEIVSSLPQTEEVKEIKNQIAKRFDFNTRGGATFLGSSKPIVKMHGCSTSDTPFACLELLSLLAENNLPEKIDLALMNE